MDGKPGGIAQEQLACLTRLAAGDDDWPRFWRLYGRLILWELRRLGICEPFVWDDIFQDLAIKLLARDCRIIRQYLARAERGSFSGLLCLIVRHLGIAYLRRRGLTQRSFPLDELPELEDLAGGAECRNPAGRLQQERELRSLLAQVTGGENTLSFNILFLRFIRQDSVNSIAERTGLQPNAVSQRLKYYLEKLRAQHRLDLLEMADEQP